MTGCGADVRHRPYSLAAPGTPSFILRPLEGAERRETRGAWRTHPGRLAKPPDTPGEARRLRGDGGAPLGAPLRRFLSPGPCFRARTGGLSPSPIRAAFAALHPRRVQPLKAAPHSRGGRRPEASRCRGYEPQQQAPHPAPSSKRLAKTPSSRTRRDQHNRAPAREDKLFVDILVRVSLLSQGASRSPHSHFFHLKNRIGSTATSTIKNSANG